MQFRGMGQHSVKCMDSVSFVVQKRLNRSSCPLGGELDDPKESTSASPGKYGLTIMRGGYEWVCYHGWRRGLFQISLRFLVYYGNTRGITLVVLTSTIGDANGTTFGHLKIPSSPQGVACEQDVQDSRDLHYLGAFWCYAIISSS